MGRGLMARTRPPLRVGKHAHKQRSCGLYFTALQRLAEMEPSSSGIVRFPLVFEKLGRTFSISKPECWELLFMFRDLGFIEIVPYQGVRMKV